MKDLMNEVEGSWITWIITTTGTIMMTITDTEAVTTDTQIMIEITSVGKAIAGNQGTCTMKLIPTTKIRTGGKRKHTNLIGLSHLPSIRVDSTTDLKSDIT